MRTDLHVWAGISEPLKQRPHPRVLNVFRASTPRMITSRDTTPGSTQHFSALKYASMLSTTGKKRSVSSLEDGAQGINPIVIRKDVEASSANRHSKYEVDWMPIWKPRENIDQGESPCDGDNLLWMLEALTWQDGDKENPGATQR